MIGIRSQRKTCRLSSNFTKSSQLTSLYRARILAAAGSVDYLIFSFLAWFLIERFGRRRVMMVSAFACSACWTTISISLGLSETGKANAYSMGALATTAFFLFFASFGSGVLGVPWLYPTEINHISFRAKGASLAMSTNWIMNYMVRPPTLQSMPQAPTKAEPVVETGNGWLTLASFGCLESRSHKSHRRESRTWATVSGSSGPFSAPASSRRRTFCIRRRRTVRSRISIGISKSTETSLCSTTRWRRS